MFRYAVGDDYSDKESNFDKAIGAIVTPMRAEAKEWRSKVGRPFPLAEQIAGENRRALLFSVRAVALGDSLGGSLVCFGGGELRGFGIFVRHPLGMCRPRFGAVGAPRLAEGIARDRGKHDERRTDAREYPARSA